MPFKKGNLIFINNTDREQYILSFIIKMGTRLADFSLSSY